MDKHKLRGLPVLPAPAWMTRAASAAKLRRNDIELWYADVEQVDDITILRVYERSKLIGGIADRETYRVFLDVPHREYLSQEPAIKSPRCWREGRLDNVLARSDIYNAPYFSIEPGHVEKGYSPYLSFDGNGENLLRAALGPLEDFETWGLRIYRWQDEILSERRRKRHEKELEPVNALMAKVPELPENFAEWICTEGIARFDYAIYTPPKGKKATDMQCTRCGAKMQIDVRVHHPVKDKPGICPACGRSITWKTVTSKLNRTGRYWGWDEPWYTAIIQRMKEGLVIRYFATDVEFVFRDGEVVQRKCTYWEVARDVFRENGRGPWSCEYYEKIRYKNQGNVRWAPAVGEYKTMEAFLYTDNLPDVLKGTIWQYSGVKELQEHARPHRIMLNQYLRAYPQNQYLEYFSKMGLTRLVKDTLLSCAWSDTGWAEEIFDTGENKPAGILRVLPQDVKTLVRHNGGFTMLEVMQNAVLRGIRLSEDEMFHFMELFGSRDDKLNSVFAGDVELDIHKLLKYFRKQADKFFDKDKWNRRYTKAEALLSYEQSLWKDWRDYLGWIERFMPECLTDEYYILPPDLPKAHDRLMQMALEQKEKEAAERHRKQEEAVNRILSEMKETGGIGMQARGLMIRLPRDAGEIRREGELQHHCVATYIDRVERHETLILFVRKIEDPDTPFYTMEWKDGKVAQCRGMRNADMTPEVKAFVSAFERKMQKKDQEAGRQRVRVTA